MAFLLDILLEARVSKEIDKMSSLMAFRSSQFDQIYKYEADCVDASVLEKFTELLSEKKRLEFITLFSSESVSISS